MLIDMWTCLLQFVVNVFGNFTVTCHSVHFIHLISNSLFCALLVPFPQHCIHCKLVEMAVPFSFLYHS